MPFDPSPFEALDFPRPTGMRLRELESGRSDEGNRRFEVLCAVRRKWVLLEPEEWVRQHLVAHLVTLGWPLGRTTVEYPAQFGQAQGRIDVAVLDPQGQPALIAECTSARRRPLASDTRPTRALPTRRGRTVCCRNQRSAAHGLAQRPAHTSLPLPGLTLQVKLHQKPAPWECSTASTGRARKTQ